MLDGKNSTAELNGDVMRTFFAVVSQEPTLLATTVRDNIKFGFDTASEQQVIDAAKMANAHEFVSAFKDGYDTLVGERGVVLSGGQKQRIAIARAVIRFVCC